MTIRELLSAISRREWRLVFVAAVVAMVITSLPPLYGWLVGLANGTPWTGIQFWAPGDFAYYLSLIDQASNGALFSANRFTTAETIPAFNVLWWSVGRFAALLSLSPVAAFYVVRTLLIPVLGVTAYVSVAYFLQEARSRKIAFLLLFFSSGFGTYFFSLFSKSAIGSDAYQMPIDMYVSEAHLFASMTYSPHFVASWILLLLSALMLMMAFDNRRLAYGMFAGAVAMLLFQFHPYHAPTLYFLGGIYLAVSLLLRSEKIWKQVAVFVSFAYFSAPSLVYHYLTMTSDTMGREIIAGSATPTPHPLHLIIGFGAFSFLAPIGFYLWQKSRRSVSALVFLSAWIVSSVVLSYAGFVFERRLLEGVLFPLVILSVPVVLWFLNWIRSLKRQKYYSYAVIGLLVIYLFLPTTFASVYRHFLFYNENQPPVAYFSAEEAEAVHWIRNSTTEDAVFYGEAFSGAVATGWGGRRTHFGHWVNSGDRQQRLDELKKFFSEYSSDERAEFMHARDIDYLYFSPREKALGKVSEDEYFQRVFGNGNIEIFELR